MSETPNGRRPQPLLPVRGDAQTALARALEPAPAPVELPAPKHLRVAPKVSRKVLRQRRRARYAVVGVAALSAASMFLLVTFHVFAAQSSFQLSKLETERTAAQRENEMLRDKVATLSSATAIARAAIARGMVRPPTVVLLKLPGTAQTAGGSSPSTAVTLPATNYPALVKATP